ISDISSGSNEYNWEDASYFYSHKLDIDSDVDVELGGLALTVSGKFENSSDSLFASASLQADNISLSQTCYEYEDYLDSSDGFHWHYDNDCTTGEGVTGNLKLAVNFDLDLVGMSDSIN